MAYSKRISARFARSNKDILGIKRINSGFDD